MIKILPHFVHGGIWLVTYDLQLPLHCCISIPKYFPPHLNGGSLAGKIDSSSSFTVATHLRGNYLKVLVIVQINKIFKND